MSFFSRKKPADGAGQSVAQTIYDVARGVSDRFGEVAHPQELLKDEKFMAAVRAVASLSHPFGELAIFAIGENSTIASLALLALAERGDQDAVPYLLEHINGFSSQWTKFIALAALEKLVPAPQPLLGRVLIALNDDWYDGYQRFLKQFIVGFVARRVGAGEAPTFNGELANAKRIHDVEAVLRQLDRDIAAPFRAELEAFQSQRTDTDFLRTFAKVWRAEPPAGVVEHEQLTNAAAFIEQTLSADRRRSVLVIGEEGTGKSVVIRSAAERLRAQGWVIFEAGATDILSGQSYIGELEERMQKMLKTIRAPRRVAWIVPRIEDLLYAGQHRFNRAGVLDLVLPEIDSGSICVIGEITTTAYQKLVEQRRRVATSFVTLRLEPLDEERTLELAREWSKKRDAEIDSKLLAEAWQLATQYLGMRAAPGNLLGLLETTLTRVKSSITLDDLLVTLSQMTGLPHSILDDREGLDLAGLRKEFASRVLGQPEAIDLLVERVAMIKAGVTDPTRPFGVFLFAGPTGTGKTEIAKTLAEYLFGSADRMIRIDMSELKTFDSTHRLIGDRDENATSTSLVDSIRKQPFSVVLLDEFEKAHSAVWDLFLQVFDDGRLTDGRGATADFRHSLIIMTSNIGAAIQTSGRAGFADSGSGFQIANVNKALEREFRKEFINRIDRIVVFRPLSRETMRAILRRELSEVFHRRGLRNRNWAVEWDERAIDVLLAEGFTPDLGARPLKRAVERKLLTPLAEMIVTRRAPAGDQFLFIRADGEELKIDFVDPDATESAATTDAAPTAEDPIESLILNATGDAATIARLQREHDALASIVRGEEWRERKSIALSMTSVDGFWSSTERFEILGEAEMRDRIESALENAGSLLERLRTRAPAELARRVAQQLWLIRNAVEDLRAKRPAEAVVLIESSPDAGEWAHRITTMYREWARARGMRVDLRDRRNGSVMLSVSGFAAHTLLAPESGLHVFEVPEDGRNTFQRVSVRVRVAVDETSIGEVNENVVVRRYREEPSPLVRDSVRNWRTGRIDLVLGGNFDVITGERP